MHSNIAEKEVYRYSRFHETLASQLHKYAPVNKKIVRYNNNSYMMRTLRKAIILKLKLKNRYIKSPSIEDWDNDKRQRNFCGKYFETLKETTLLALLTPALG